MKHQTPFFNQTSLSNFDGRNTVNIGIGARYIFNADTTILGANTFFDYELIPHTDVLDLEESLLPPCLKSEQTHMMLNQEQLAIKVSMKQHLMVMI